MKISRSPRSAAALLIVLSALVLLSILVVGLTVATRMERSASFYNLERTRAELAARQGIDCGTALLVDATGTGRFWISGAGRVLASATNAVGLPDIVIPLTSGVTTDTNSNVSANLNRTAIGAGDRILNPVGTNFNVQWLYIQKDGSYATAVSSNSVGRFAYWVDDDSSRVNLNTARARSTPLTANPSQISLGALPGLAPWANAISAETEIRPVTTPLEIFGRNDLWTNALFTNRFFLTHYSQDPDVNPWGEPRFVLTTRASAATNRRYLQILDNPSADPGIYANLSATNLQTLYAAMTAPLSRTNWPYAVGGSFVAKYGADGAAQLGIDILEYVRTAESYQTWIDPIVATVATNSITLLPETTGLSGIGANAFIGTVRRPMISQVGVHCSTNTNSAATGFLGSLHVQTWLPAGYNAGGSSFSGWTLWAQIASSSGTFTNTITESLGTVAFTNGYAANTLTNIDIPATVGSGIPPQTLVRLAILKNPAPAITNILDIAPLREGQFISVPTTTNITAYASVNDPRVNKAATNWSASTNLPGDVPPPAHSPNLSAFASPPASDGSTNSVILRQTNSTVASVAELGYVASGISSTPPAPWRSLRLQVRSSSSTNVPPDWALLDLFSAPVSSRFVPGTNAVAGRVNLNAIITGTQDLTRTNVLNALFENVSGIAAANLPTVVSNVITTQLAAGGLNFGGATNSTNFFSVGQLAEIAGIGDQNEAGEQILHQVASLATVRSGVFSIYSCGQAISYVNQKVVVNGEKILQATVERYYDASGIVRYRTISWAEIYP